MLRDRYDSAVVATLNGLLGRFRGDPVKPLGVNDRLDGRVALVTGANRGLGRAIATQLAERGAHVLCACRGDAGATLADARKVGSAAALSVDLSDLQSIDRLVDEIEQLGRRIDVLVLNAAVVPNGARRTTQGLELQLGVNFLANVHLVDKLLRRDLLERSARSRIVLVSSESHRSGKPVDPTRLGVFEPYGVSGVVARYGQVKQFALAWLLELAKELDGLGVFAICPGAVATDIAREAPTWAKPVLDPVMRALFRNPSDAAKPVVYLAVARALDERTGQYFHRWDERSPAEPLLDAGYRAAVTRAARELVAAHVPAK
ncbi:MAG: SDR family NAD(P)-dependent oxidoreductase [Polyangiaceae bacterium]